MSKGKAHYKHLPVAHLQWLFQLVSILHCHEFEHFLPLHCLERLQYSSRVAVWGWLAFPLWILLLLWWTLCCLGPGWKLLIAWDYKGVPVTLLKNLQHLNWIVWYKGPCSVDYVFLFASVCQMSGDFPSLGVSNREVLGRGGDGLSRPPLNVTEMFRNFGRFNFTI